MQSPFPGMDPYLEVPSRWQSVHTRLLVFIAATLTDALAPDFIVTIEERVYIATLDDLMQLPWIQPDVFLVGTSTEVSGGEVQNAVIAPPLLIEPFDEEEEIHERYLEIIDAATRAVVTTIEVLSPTNKVPRTSGRKKFLAKRQRIFASRTHWLEIDLLRAGERPVEVQGRGDYYALLRRGVAKTRFEVWATSLRDQLPVIAVPTYATSPDTPLDLQAVVDRVYRIGRYDTAINYDRPIPAPPLLPDDERWVQERIAVWRQARDESRE